MPIIEGYGLSEGTCARRSTRSRAAQAGHGRACRCPGRPSGSSTRRADRSADGEAGEVSSGAPNVMRGYSNRPEETAETIVDGWLHTGDIGRLDEDGYLVLVDRTKDMIIRGGENIYPEEIEAVVHHLPQIAEAAVVGRPNPSSARSRSLFVSTAPGRGRHARGDSRSHRRAAREIQTAGRHHDPRRPAEESRRQDRQTRSAPAAGRLARHHIDKRELNMGFTSRSFPRSIRRPSWPSRSWNACASLRSTGPRTASGRRRWCMRSTS